MGVENINMNQFQSIKSNDGVTLQETMPSYWKLEISGMIADLQLLFIAIMFLFGALLLLFAFMEGLKAFAGKYYSCFFGSMTTLHFSIPWF